jgi:hypothetical protein
MTSSTAADDDTSAVRLGTALATAVGDGDVDELASLFAPTARIWHNYDGREQTPEENRAMLLRLRKAIPDLRYEDVRNDAVPGGFVQQQVLCGERHGVSFRVPSMFRAWVTGNQIERIEEYLDPGALA